MQLAGLIRTTVHGYCSQSPQTWDPCDLMKVFHCSHCRHLAFFENTLCVSCGHTLAFLPELMSIGSLDPVEGDTPGLWTSPLAEAKDRVYRLCANYTENQVCNWAVDAAGPDLLCRSCRLTRVIPDLTVAGNHTAWYRLEVAKRRLLYTLLTLRLPIEGEGPDGVEPLGFQFLADAPDGAAPVLTGHSNGLVTINLAEADDAERERRRTALHEPYRTLLGHMRHEVGHYYWARIVGTNPERIEAFRALFGNDADDYAQALQRHYDSGPPADWQDRFVSAYSSAHAWEDFAETWAHYLHMADTIETAAACGVSLRPPRADEPSMAPVRVSVTQEGSFDRMLESWFPITYLLNNLNRGLGHQDAYPFVLSLSVIEKLRFVHDTIAAAALAAASNPQVAASTAATVAQQASPESQAPASHATTGSPEPAAIV